MNRTTRYLFPGGIDDDDDNDNDGKDSSSSMIVMIVKFINQYT